MARKKKPEEHENHERWLVSYADFITLLFAFFVVMYSMSSVNEGKYRVLSESMNAAFRPITKSFAPIQFGENVRSIRQPDFSVIMDVPIPINIKPEIPGKSDVDVQVETESDATQAAGGDGEGEFPVNATLQFLEGEVQDAFGELIEDEQIGVRQNPLWMEIEIKSNILFTSGSADLATPAEEILARMGDILSRYPNPLMVEGFTDNMPIQNSIFPSNWELSSARAASVVRLFETSGVDSIRMSSVGFGEHRPKQPNDTAEGRSQNRRVIVVVMADLQADNAMDPNLQMETLEKMRQRYNYAQETAGWW